MAGKNLVDTALLMDNDVNSISEAARKILRGLKEATDEDIGQSGDPVSFFFDGVTKIVLNWMGTGKIGQVQDLLSNIRSVLNEEAEDVHCLDSLSINNQLTIKLQSLGQFMAVFLKTSNLSKYMGLLSGKRRATWRRALQWMYEYDQPVRANDLYAEGLFNKINTADNALNQLAAMGLLHKRTEDAQAAVYELTWAGRSVCKALPDDIVKPSTQKEESESKEPIIVPFNYLPKDMIGPCRRAQKRLKDGGIWRLTG